jgi:protoporphyrinogen oxidase
MSRKVMKFLILGAGPTALGAGYRLRELGQHDFLLLEASGQVGGLAASYRDDRGFVWDVGGHVQFSHYDYFDDLMARVFEAGGWLRHQRESWAWLDGRFVPYPVQNNIRYLSKEKAWACLDGVITANLQAVSASPPGNFREWILSRFGPGLAETFMFPYNFKVWAHPLEELDYRWVGDRVAVADLRRTARNMILEQDDLSWGPNNTFQFPRSGGTGAIWEAVASLIGREKIKLRSPVSRVNWRERSVTCVDGGEFFYEHLITTVPLDRLVSMLRPARPELAVAAAGLKYSSSNIVGLGMSGRPPDAIRTKCWIYFPEADCPFYRVTVFSNYSPNNVPDASQYWSLMAETSESPCKPVDQSRLVEDTIQGCLNTGLLLDREQVVSIWSHRAAHGYPTPSLGRDAALAVIQPGLEEMDIFSRGRFGAWKYEVSNQDHSLMQGVELVDRLLAGVPETTIHRHEAVNGGARRSR